MKNKKPIIAAFLIILLTAGAVAYFNKFNTYQYEKVGFFPLPKLRPAWERKIPTTQVMRVGLITDTHVHASRINKEDKSPEGKRVLKIKHRKPLEQFNGQMDEFDPEVIVMLGDVIEGTNEKDYVGMWGLKLVKDKISREGVPIIWLVGNHDLRSVTKDQFKETLGIDYLNKSFDFGDYRFIVVDASYNAEGFSHSPTDNKFIPGNLPKENLEWLESELQTDKHVFIFMHQGPFDRKLPGEKGGKRSIANATELRALLEKYHVSAIFNGHIEVRHHEEVGGVEYFSLTGTKKSFTYPDSFYELTIDAGEPSVTMFYSDGEEGDNYQSVDFKDQSTYLPLKKEEREKEGDEMGEAEQ
jgi:Icc-related predicted phosphoesterase